MEFNWKTKGIVLTAPLSHEVDDVVKFIDEYLAPRGFNMIVMQVRYRYQFKKHPEVWGYDPLSFDDVKRILSICRKNNITIHFIILLSTIDSLDTTTPKAPCLIPFPGTSVRCQRS